MPPLPETTDLRARAIEAVRSHWREPRFSDGPTPSVPAERVEAVARTVLDALLTRPFRVGPRPAPEVYAELLRRVQRQIGRGEPLKISMGYGALKNPNAVLDSRADWAEFFALCHLVAWHNKVQAIYPPGLSIRIVLDDATLLWANRGDARLMAAYRASLDALIRALRFERVLRPPVRLLWLSWLCYGLYPLAQWRVRRWERDPAHREQFEQMSAAARRNLVLPPGLEPEQVDRAAGLAAHRYRVYWEALRLSCLSRGKRHIIALYLDGSQHHIRQPVTLHLTTLDKGQVTQPWQGEGGLRDNGHGRLEPYVLTAGRRLRSVVRTVDGLDLVPLPGFDRITVSWTSDETALESKSVDATARTEPGMVGRMAERPL